MNIINTFKQAFAQPQFGLSRHRVDLLSRLICALIQTRCVNLKKLASALWGSAKIESHYRRLQRFFASGLSYSIFAQPIAGQLVCPGKQVLLVLDRTYWTLGATHLNLLSLGILYQGVAVPLTYLSLHKPGNSNTQERKKVVEAALSYLKGHLFCLLADREFIGKAWFKFLVDAKIEFIIRIRAHTWAHLDDGRLRQLSRFTRTLPKGQTRYYASVTIYGEVTLNLICHRPQKGEAVLLVTNRSDLPQVLELYRNRWAIETAFGFLKSRGFHLEETHLTKPQRLYLLIGLLSLCLVWCLRIGDRLNERKSISIKKHGRRAISLFRLGLDHLHHLFANVKYCLKELSLSCRLLLSCT